MTAPFEIVTALCALGCGLAGGVFFAFSTFVMVGLARLSPVDGINAMNAINVAAVTPVFMALLFGTGVLCAIAILMLPWHWGEPRSTAILLGGALYFAGVIVVTMIRNVPLNNALTRLESTAPSSTAIWKDYLRDWTRWNHVRTISCTVSCALFIVALSLHPSQPLPVGCYSLDDGPAPACVVRPGAEAN